MLKRATRNSRRTHQPVSTVEALEDRALLTNIAVTGASLVDGDSSPIIRATVGEQIAVRVDYDTDNLALADYRVEFKVDGITIDVVTNQGTGTGNAGSHSLVGAGWFATAGSHVVEVIVDRDDVIAEDSEIDNSISFTVLTTTAVPGARFAWPVEGVAQVDSFIENYVDVDPTAGVADFDGGIYSYDGHEAWNITVPHFEDQDAGVDIIAAAAGTVVEINDGEFDRQTAFNDPAPAANYVIIDHGDGYETIYSNLRRDSVQVQVGDVVVAGDKLGSIGSSGFSDGSGLQFGLRHNGLPVEPMMDPSAYLLDVPAYSADVLSLLSSRITSYQIGNDLLEGPARVSVFDRDDGVSVTVFGQFSSLKLNDLLEYVWIRPNGTEFRTDPFIVDQDYQTFGRWFSRVLDDNPIRGVWTIQFRVNGQPVGSDQFEIRGGGSAEMLVLDNGGTIVRDQRYTPIDFGTVAQAATPPETTFLVRNIGSRDLNIDRVVAPTGFTITQDLPATIAPGDSSELIVELDSTFAGYSGGEIFIESDDFDTPLYRFSVEGQVQAVATPDLVLGIGERTIGEGDRTVGNVRRSGGDNSVDLVVDITVDDAAQLNFPASVTIPAGEDYVNFIITGVDDPTVDGDMILEVTAGAIGYSSALNTLEVLDNDFAAVQIVDTGVDSVVSESGTTDTVNVVLLTQPLTDVVFTVSREDATELSVPSALLTFTNANWDVPQAIVVTGVDDLDLDGGISSLVSVQSTAASDPEFQSLTADIAVLNTDNDVAGIQILPSGGSTVVSESGTTDTVSVLLSSGPLTDVVVEVVSSDSTESSPSPTLLTFTPLDWDISQAVTITGVDDVTLDGNRTSNIVVTVRDLESFEGYAGTESSIAVTTLDNDVAGISLVPSGGSNIVFESGTSDAFDVTLPVQPLTDVVVTLASTNTSEVLIAPALMTFTPANWNVAQVATVMGVDDSIADGNQSPTIVVTVQDITSDPAFHGTAAGQQVINVDDDAVIVVDASGGTSVVSESGTIDTVQVSLKALPLGEVLIDVFSGAPDEVSASVGRLTFTPADWDVPVEVTLTGVDDAVVDGDQNSFVFFRAVDALSHPAFAGALTDTLVTTLDDESAGIIVTPTDGGTSVRENGTADTVDITLNSRPLSDVVVQVSSGDTGEVVTAGTLLTFTPAAWDIAQSVTVLGVNDVTLDGDQTTTMSVTVIDSQSQNLFDGVVQPFDVITVDDEVPSWTIVESGGSNVVDENGGSDTFTIVLDAQPTSVAPVTVELVTTSPDEIDTSPKTLTFTSTNWNVVRTVTILGVDDPGVDGSQTVPLTLRTIDAETNDAFDGQEQTLTVENLDNDVAGVVLAQSEGSTIVAEGGTTDSVDVTLRAQPLGDVVLTVLSADVNQATAIPELLTFTPANWNIAQSVTVTATDDIIADGDATVQIAFSAVDAESHMQFHGVTEILVVNVWDNDAAIVVTESGGATTVSESGTSDEVEVRLAAEPLASVVISAVARDSGEASATPSFITFTTTNWNVAQTVTVSGVDDVLLDGTQITPIDIAVVDNQSAVAYNGLSDIVNVGTTDDDMAEILVVESGGSTIVSEELFSDSFSVTLASRPLTTVVLDVASLDTTEVTVSPATLTFTPTGWNIPQSVTVNGVDDIPVDGDILTQVVVSTNAGQSDPGFAGKEAVVPVTNVDNEVASFTVQQTGGSTIVSERMTFDEITVVLGASPTDLVVLEVISTDTTEAVVDTSLLTFTPSNWTTPQLVTITGVDDPTVDGSQVSLIQVRVVDSVSDNAFDGLVDSSVQVTTTSDDVAGFSIVETQCSTVVHETGTSDTFMVRLDRQPLTGIVFFTDTSNPGELSVTPAELVFTSANWDQPQEVTVTGLDDSVADTNGPFQVFVSIVPSRSDNAFDDLTRRAIGVENISNEAGLAAHDDAVTIARDTSVVIDVVSNDTPVGGARVASVGSPTSGTVELRSTGAIEFTPDDGFVGTASFDYEIVGGQGKLISPDAVEQDEFGHALATDGNLMVVGVPELNAVAEDSGAAFVYEQRADGGWGKIAKITAPDGEDFDAFGYAVAVDGDTVVVSARMDDDMGRNAGAVYVFERNLGGANAFGFVTKLTDATGSEKDQFGHSVDVEGGTIIVGARLDDDAGRNSGTAFVYDRFGSTWSLTAKLLPDIVQARDQFGFDVAIDGDLFVVSARKSDELGTDAGSVYVIDRNLGGTNAFGVAAHLTAADGVQFDWFGQSVDINNDTVVVGKPIRNGRQRTGRVYVFGRDEGGANAWGQVTQVATPDEAVANQFGYSISLTDSDLYVGARLDQNVSKDGGRVYAFGAATDWAPSRTIDSTDSANGDYFGQSVAASADAVFIGAPRDDDNGGRSGSVFTEDLTTDTATVTVTVTAPLLARTIGSGDVDDLTEDALADAVDAAVAEWIGSGISAQQAAQLQTASFSIADLRGNQLGGAFGSSIIVDTNAAGHGWSVNDGPGYDLHSVVLHELGHLLGHDDRYEAADSNDIMFGFMEPGQQRSVDGNHDLFFQGLKAANDFDFGELLSAI